MMCLHWRSMNWVVLVPLSTRFATRTASLSRNSSGIYLHPPRCIFCKREEGPVVYVITFMDELAIRVPSLDAWDQFIWPPATAVLWALTEAEPYGYCHGQAVDLGPVMLVAQFRVMDEVGTYLCVV